MSRILEDQGSIPPTLTFFDMWRETVLKKSI